MVIIAMASLTVACTSPDQTPKEAVKKASLTADTLKSAIKTDSLTAKQLTLDQLIALFQKKPSFPVLDSIENAIQIQLPGLAIEQRYKLLDQWQKVFSPNINRLDPGQTKLLPLFDQLEVSWIDGESANNRRKRVETKFQKGLSPEQKTLFQQLLNHHIEIKHEEETGAIFHLSPSYWKSLFASNLLKDDRKFWDQTALENDPVIDYDAGLAIDRVTLGDWAFYWEQFLKQYPKSHYKKEAQRNYQSYLSHLLVGLENTPTTEDNSNKVLAEVAQDFDKISKRHPGSDVALSILAFRKTLAASPEKIDLYNLSKSSIITATK
ncbi:hypothetical protein [Pedobacter sp. KBW06]|uniref:hypothetical protein n=1 Tax=Pedobacter sp. KBW06 TaxID=2153359 RepID=UPI000F5A5715|nr:hypothetical protein [Pedobacter sp. KBW06]